MPPVCEIPSNAPATELLSECWNGNAIVVGAPIALGVDWLVAYRTSTRPIFPSSTRDYSLTLGTSFGVWLKLKIRQILDMDAYFSKMGCDVLLGWFPQAGIKHPAQLGKDGSAFHSTTRSKSVLRDTMGMLLASRSSTILLCLNYNLSMGDKFELPPDPVIEAYKKDVDRTLIRRNLTLTVEERLLQLARLQEFAEELRRAGAAARKHRD